jgi:hypothetical protein
VPKADGAAAGWEPNAKVPLEVKLLVSEPKPPLPNALGAALVAPNGLLNGAGVLKDGAGAAPNTEAAGLNALSPPPPGAPKTPNAEDVAGAENAEEEAGVANADEVAGVENADEEAPAPKGKEPEAVSDGAGAEAGADAGAPPNMNIPDEGAAATEREGVSVGAPNANTDVAGVLLDSKVLPNGVLVIAAALAPGSDESAMVSSSSFLAGAPKLLPAPKPKLNGAAAGAAGSFLGSSLALS